jgi:integrase
MKSRRDHQVPLATQVVELLHSMKGVTGHRQYVFAGLRDYTKPISDNTLNAGLRAMGYDGTRHVAHGFRATARTLLDEHLNFRVDIIEHQLAHVVRGPNGAAYNRTTHLPKRVEMMQGWADYLDGLAGPTVH